MRGEIKKLPLNSAPCPCPLHLVSILGTEIDRVEAKDQVIAAAPRWVVSVAAEVSAITLEGP
jgi:hypothetical protein